MARSGFGDGPHEAALIEGDAFDPRSDGVAALDRAGRGIEPVEFTPAVMTARDP